MRSTSSRCCGHERRSPGASASSCTRTCPTSRATGRGRSARSGYGRRWRRPTCRCWTSSTPRPGRVTLSLTPVLCDQLEAPGVGERFLAFLREVRAETHRLDVAAAEDPARRARARALGGALRGGRRALRGARRRPGRAPSRRTRRGRRRRRTPSCRCWPRRPGCACSSRPGSPRTAGASATWDGGLLAARVRLRDVARRAARGGGGPCRLRRPHRRARLRRPGPAAAAAELGRAAARPDRPGDHGPRLAHERVPVPRRLPRHAALHRAPPHAMGGRRQPV